jgi:hypothetical protein
MIAQGFHVDTGKMLLAEREREPADASILVIPRLKSAKETQNERVAGPQRQRRRKVSE